MIFHKVDKRVHLDYVEIVETVRTTRALDRTHNPKVTGSNPVPATRWKAELAAMPARPSSFLGQTGVARLRARSFEVKTGRPPARTFNDLADMWLSTYAPGKRSGGDVRWAGGSIAEDGPQHRDAAEDHARARRRGRLASGDPGHSQAQDVARHDLGTTPEAR